MYTKTGRQYIGGRKVGGMLVVTEVTLTHDALPPCRGVWESLSTPSRQHLFNILLINVNRVISPQAQAGKD